MTKSNTFQLIRIPFHIFKKKKQYTPRQMFKLQDYISKMCHFQLLRITYVAKSWPDRMYGILHLVIITCGKRKKIPLLISSVEFMDLIQVLR